MSLRFDERIKSYLERVARCAVAETLNALRVAGSDHGIVERGVLRMNAVEFRINK